MFEIRKISAEDTYSLRHKVLRPHQQFENVKYDTDKLEGTFHYGAYNDKVLVSIVSFNLEQLEGFDGSRHYRLRAMATQPEYRGQGSGREVALKGIEEAFEKGADFVWCKARIAAVGFYEKLGFIRVSDEYDYPGIGIHVNMVKKS